MLLSEIIHPGVIRIGLKANTKWEAIEELVDVLVDAHEIPLSARDLLLDAVKKREDSQSTGMEHGIALPHASTDRVEDIVAALAVLKEGIEFESIDGLPARIILLLAVPRRNFQGHVRTLAGVAHLMGNAEFRKLLHAAGNPTAVMELIEAEEDKAVFLDKK